MRFPRFSIASILALTVAIALDRMAARAGKGSDDGILALLFFGVLPWA
jgi:hypothetical protein